MRRHITWACAAAAGATITALALALAGSAGAATHGSTTFSLSVPVTTTNTHCTTPPTLPSDNCAMAGYVASNRDFRYAQALITGPDHIGDVHFDPQIYVGLDNSSSGNYTYVRAGVTPCGTPVTGVRQQPVSCPNSGWEAYTEAFRDGTDVFADFIPLAGAVEGDKVYASVYQELSGNVVDAKIVLPDGTTHTFAVGMSGATFVKAQALADWTNAHANGTAVAPTPAFPMDIRDTQFNEGAFTTVNGQRGTFKGPWMLGALDSTTNGTMLGTIMEEPAYMWNDGQGNGWGDAFGVWNRVS